MTRLKKNVFVPTEPLVIKEEKEENGNGSPIPIKIDDFSVYYDIKEKSYFAVAKFEGKKILFEEVKA